jgi:hypothetical protein
VDDCRERFKFRYVNHYSVETTFTTMCQAVSYDDMGPVGEDPRWKPHEDFARFLEKEYPRVYVASSPHHSLWAHVLPYVATKPSSTK